MDDKKMASFSGGRERLAIKEPETTKTAMVGISNDDVIEDFDFEKLTGSDEIASNFDVRLGRSGITAGMVVGDNNCRSTGHDG